MSDFRIVRNHGAIPCSVTYSILDASRTVLFSETVTNPPAVVPSPPNGTGIPVYAEIIVSGNKVIVDLNCCCPIELFCNCPPLNAYHLFKICVEPDPAFITTYFVTVYI